MSFQEICAALAEMAGSEQESAKLAAAMLAVLEQQAEDGPEPDPDKPDEEPSPEDEAVSTTAELAATVARLSQELHAMKASQDAEKRDQLLASRPDLGKDLLAVLSKKPFGEVQAIVSAMPKPALPVAITRVAATRGAKDGPQLPAKDKGRLDRAMGLAKAQAPTIVTRGSRDFIGVPADYQPRAED